MEDNNTIKKAIISVSDKTGILDLAKNLERLGIEIISTGGTAKHLRNGGVQVKEVAEVTGFPEILTGRLKTLHPVILGGILGRPDNEKDLREMREHHIQPIGLVICNLYPFAQTIKTPDVTINDAIEMIDIGGPTMLRAAAKNYLHVGVVIDPKDYPLIVKELQENKNRLSLELKKELSHKVFEHTHNYDESIYNYLADSDSEAEEFPKYYRTKLEKVKTLRYGENPHQNAALYRIPDHFGLSLVDTKQFQGKELSYNNILDAHAALSLLTEFSDPAAVIIKHNNPSGCSIGNSARQAYKNAHSCDPISAFGSILGINRVIDKEIAYEINQMQLIEVIIAPEFSKDAIEIFAKRKNCRLLSYQPAPPNPNQHEYRYIFGGVLIQECDLETIRDKHLRVATERQPTDSERDDLLFAFSVVKHVRSNGIVVAKNKSTIGIGAGQMSRVDSVNIAIQKAGVDIKGAVLASDGFFPFPDSIEAASKAGITAIIQPGGSIRDDEVIKSANKHNIAMLFTGVRHFKH